MKNRMLSAAALMILAACGPTGESPQSVDCKDGSAVVAGDETYCLFAAAITEEGFECPADVSTGRRFGGIVVCSSGSGMPPQELFDAIPGEFPGETLPEGDCAGVLCDDLSQVCGVGGQCKVPQEVLEQCFAECGVGCPEPEFQLCGEDGNLYCGACTLGCANVREAPDRSACEQTEEQCIEECGVGCPEPGSQPCASDGERYCSTCVIECKGLTEVDAAMCM